MLTCWVYGLGFVVLNLCSPVGYVHLGYDLVQTQQRVLLHLTAQRCGDAHDERREVVCGDEAGGKGVQVLPLIKEGLDVGLRGRRAGGGGCWWGREGGGILVGEGGGWAVHGADLVDCTFSLGIPECKHGQQQSKDREHGKHPASPGPP